MGKATFGHTLAHPRTGETYKSDTTSVLLTKDKKDLMYLRNRLVCQLITALYVAGALKVFGGRIDYVGSIDDFSEIQKIRVIFTDFGNS